MSNYLLGSNVSVSLKMIFHSFLELLISLSNINNKIKICLISKFLKDSNGKYNKSILIYKLSNSYHKINLIAKMLNLLK